MDSGTMTAGAMEIKGSIDGMLANLPRADEGWEEKDPVRAWKSSLLLIKPEYLFAPKSSTPKRTIGSTVQRGDATWVRFTDGTVIGLKNEGEKIVAVREPDYAALVELGAIDESRKGELFAAEVEKLKAKYEV